VAEFAESDFLPHVQSRFADKRSTLAYYEIQARHLTGRPPLAGAPIGALTPEIVSGFVAKRRGADYQVFSINRALQVLRRMRRLAVEWGRVEKAMAPISLLPGERRRERVLSPAEEAAYLQAAHAIGEKRLEAYTRALKGIRATQRGQRPTEPEDPFLLRDVATILLDEGIRPEECHRLEWEQIRDGAMHVPFGKTVNARRSISLTNRVAALLDVRKAAATSQWVFPATTESGHIEQSSLKKAARDGVQDRRHRILSALHVPPHMPDAVVRVHGPVHAGVLCGTQRFCDDPPVRSPEPGERPGSHGTGARGAGWAQFRAQWRDRQF
jgi:integrase